MNANVAKFHKLEVTLSKVQEQDHASNAKTQAFLPCVYKCLPVVHTFFFHSRAPSLSLGDEASKIEETAARMSLILTNPIFTIKMCEGLFLPREIDMLVLWLQHV